MRKRATFDDAVKVMSRLRGPKGCPWDREQTHRSLLKYLREESEEVALAVRRNDFENLCEELGDVLHQVLFHAEIAAEKGLFTIRDVVDVLHQKLVGRHPHVFGKKKIRTSGEVVAQWEEIKRLEKKKRRPPARR